jgi:hypothetical protein
MELSVINLTTICVHLQKQNYLSIKYLKFFMIGDDKNEENQTIFTSILTERI